MQRGSLAERVLRRDERGAALVEFAVVLPILVLFVFGIVQFGLAYSARVELTNAVREGARTAAIGRSACPPASPEPATFLDDCVVASTRGAASGLQMASIDVQPTTCPATPGPADNASVRATYPMRYDIPFFRSGTWTLNAKGVMRCGG